MRLPGRFLRMSQWKKLAIVGLAASVVTLALLLLVSSMQRPATAAKQVQGWDSASVRATFAGVQVREVDPTNADVVFYYELENRTDRDYQIQSGSSLRLMSRLKSDGSLAADGRARLADSAFIPVANRTRIAIEIPRAFAWGGQNDGANGEAPLTAATGRL